MPEILIVADDLSGAADCAIGCTLAGLETLVLLEPSAALAEGGATAVAVDMDSRNMQPDRAGRAAADAIRRLHSASTRVLYHKIDSTLRGNWATELARARRAAGEFAGQMPLAIVAPAFPSHRRTMSGGRVFVEAVPLNDTETRKGTNERDAGDVPALLRRMGLCVDLLILDEVRKGPGALAASLRRLAAAGIEAAVCDAETDSDLAHIAQGSLAAGVPALWVGSGGLMRQLARAVSSGTADVAFAPAPRPGPLLFVIGSASTVSRAQFERLIEDRDIASIRVAPDMATGERGALPPDLAHALQSAVAAGRDVAVLVERGDVIDPRRGAALPTMLAALVAPKLASFGGLFATGGETARAILKAAGVAGIRLGGEVEPGVPWGTTVGETALYVVTKAGAFGDSGTLVRARHALEGLTAGQQPGALQTHIRSEGSAP